MIFLKKCLLISATLLIVQGVLTSGLVSPKTNALSAADWQAGRIIDDQLFTDPNSMSADQIQTFLNNLVPSCDTNGTQSASDYGRPDLTHAQYAALKGWAAPPYACLKNYYEVPKTSPSAGMPDNSYNHGGGAFAGGVSAAQLIYNAAQQYHISPKVLLIKLRSESAGPLTNDSWPLQSQYTYALGAHCPDSGPNNSANCDPNYAGFSIQISEAASLLRYYLDNMNQSWWPYKKIGNNVIQYNPNTSCGSSSVNITTYATAALYTYTPYQPNAAALAAGSGTASCGAYGNRNFWLYYNDWFGSTTYSPPICTSKATNVACVWQLDNRFTDSDFLTNSTAERDVAINNNQYIYDAMPFYSFTTQQPGTIPIYRLRLSGEHFYTANLAEKNSLLQSSQNTDEGVAFYEYPPSTSTNATYPIYRLNNSSGHVFVANATQRDALISQGYTSEGVAFNAPSGFASAPDPTQNSVNVYRISNGANHFYTTNLAERDALLNSGWNYEGVMMQTPSAASSTPVYRLVNNLSHMYTASSIERDQLVANGWKYEGVAWYVDNTTPLTYRFYINGEHFYTTDLNEAFSITGQGARYEGIALGFSQTTNAAVYRLFNGTYHFFTSSADEALSSVANGWKYEGVAWYGSSTSTNMPVSRLTNGSQHFYTTSDVEKNQLVANGWRYEGVAWYGSSTSTNMPVSRLTNGSQHFYTTSDVEKNQLVANGWKYEGVAWYGL